MTRVECYECDGCGDQVEAAEGYPIGWVHDLDEDADYCEDCWEQKEAEGDDQPS
jgi:hypothetical protein